MVAQRPGNERRGECADVDAHVKDRVRRIEPRVIGWIQLSNERRNIRLEKTIADDDENEAGNKVRKRIQRQQQITAAKQDSAEDDCPTIADRAIGENAAEERSEINETEIESENLRMVLLKFRVPVILVLHVQREDGGHAVEAEALPHFGEEQDI